MALVGLGLRSTSPSETDDPRVPPFEKVAHLLRSNDADPSEVWLVCTSFFSSTLMLPVSCFVCILSSIPMLSENPSV